MRNYQDRVAVITGGASGIGSSLCRTLGANQATVIVTDIDIEGAEKTARAIIESGGQAKAVLLDVTQAADVQAVLNEVAAEFGRIDYLFNNAGIGIAGEMHDIDIAQWRRIMDINLLGVIYGASIAYSFMLQQGSGHIINVSSLAGLIGYPTATPYATTKSAIVGMSLSLREEAADSGVKISVACPGFVQTDFFDSATLLHAKKEDILQQIPFSMMSADQAAQAILRGVENNRGIIIFPFYARLLWWLYRIHPLLIRPVARKIVQDFRRVKQKSQ
ncbi:MAG: SDR family oxidoreductase [Pseudomonadota bacterium]